MRLHALLPRLPPLLLQVLCCMLFTGVAKGAQGAGPCPLLIEELKKEEYMELVYATYHNLPLIMAFNVQKLPPPPFPFDKSWLHHHHWCS